MKTTCPGRITIFLMAVILTLTFTSTSSLGQNNQPVQTFDQMPSMFFGLGLGINDYGLGLSMEMPVIFPVTISGSAGIGGWGTKVAGTINFYPVKYFYKSEISLGYSYASGVSSMVADLWIEPDDQQKEVELNLKPVGTVNIIYAYNLKVGRASKFVFSAGYALPVTKISYYVETTGIELSRTSEDFLEFMKPGGIIAGVKFMFAL